MENMLELVELALGQWSELNPEGEWILCDWADLEQAVKAIFVAGQ